MIYECASLRPRDRTVDSTPETWHRFQQQELRDSVEALAPVVNVVLAIVVAGIGGYLLSSEARSVTSFGLFIAVSGPASVWHLQKRISVVSKNSSMEWRLCTAHQCVLISLLFVWSLLACSIGSVLLLHRMFYLSFAAALMCIPCLIYLPLQCHFIAVTIQSILILMIFHFKAALLDPFEICLGVVLPLLELCAYSFATRRSWHLFCVAESEKQARVTSDALRQTMWGVLNVTFDASCECDQTGRILQTSEHLHELLASSEVPSPTSGLKKEGLKELAANPIEAERVSAFLRQASLQQQKAAPGAVCPPSLLETVLRSGSAQDDGLDIKLCCVPLPADCTLYDVKPSGSPQRFFVGLQKVQTMGTGMNPEHSGACPDSNGTASEDYSDPGDDTNKVASLLPEQELVTSTLMNRRFGNGVVLPFLSTASAVSSTRDSTPASKAIPYLSTTSLAEASFLAASKVSAGQPWHAVFGSESPGSSSCGDSPSPPGERSSPSASALLQVSAAGDAFGMPSDFLTSSPLPCKQAVGVIVADSALQTDPSPVLRPTARRLEQFRPASLPM